MYNEQKRQLSGESNLDHLHGRRAPRLEIYIHDTLIKDFLSYLPLSAELLSSTPFWRTFFITATTTM